MARLEKRHPRDVDLTTFVYRPLASTDDATWRAFVATNINLLTGHVVKAVYKCDAYFVDLNTAPLNVVNQTRYWFGLFSHQRTGLWKGLLQVPLAVTQDDDDASIMVGP